MAPYSPLTASLTLREMNCALAFSELTPSPLSSAEQSHSTRQTPAFQARKCRCKPLRRLTKPEKSPGSAERWDQRSPHWNLGRLGIAPIGRTLEGEQRSMGSKSPGSAALVAIRAIRGRSRPISRLYSGGCEGPVEWRSPAWGSRGIETADLL
jgi:hypothetical protein